jgi:hypothetical protein
VLCVVLGASAGTVFLAPSYTSQAPFSYQINQNAVNYLLRVCDPPQLYQCSLSVQINLPYNAWSIPDGTYVSFQVYGDGDNCKKILCQNNITSPQAPNRCSFSYKPSQGQNIYIITKGGPAAEFPGVLDAEFQCSSEYHSFLAKREQIPVEKISYTPGVCNIPTQPTRIITESIVPLSTPTSPRTTDALQVRLSACVVPNNTNSVLTVVAYDTSSATATYICQDYPCSTGTAFAYDRSGTGYNFVQIGTVSKTEITAAIYGWGAYNSTNRFTLQFAQNL